MCCKQEGYNLGEKVKLNYLWVKLGVNNDVKKWRQKKW